MRDNFWSKIIENSLSHVAVATILLKHLRNVKTFFYKSN